MEAALAAVQADLAVLQRLAPRSDVTTALASVCQALSSAVGEARTPRGAYVDTAEYARLTGMRRSTITHRIRSGKLRADKVGGVYVISRDELEAA